MSNLLKAVKTVVDNPRTQLIAPANGRNRLNSVGDALEKYIQDIFADTFDSVDPDRMTKISKVFSYIGNSSNPPDAILRNGDAIETKKVQSPNAALALNSSYPKAKIFADSKMISKDCRDCEKWVEKDFIYAIGHTTDTSLKYLWLIYGDCFSADKEIYERIKNTISSGIEQIKGVEFTETNELGKVKKVDPLGVTDLRIRGMWHIDNPHTIFKYLNAVDANAEFQLFCLMKTDKFNSFPKADREALKKLTKKNYSISDVKIKNPNNPAKLLDCTFITFKN
jgi:hypothetical protein